MSPCFFFFFFFFFFLRFLGWKNTLSLFSIIIWNFLIISSRLGNWLSSRPRNSRVKCERCKRSRILFWGIHSSIHTRPSSNARKYWSSQLLPVFSIRFCISSVLSPSRWPFSSCLQKQMKQSSPVFPCTYERCVLSTFHCSRLHLHSGFHWILKKPEV